MRLIQHKKEAYWFYRFLSMGYDSWVNPLFWTPEMRAAALELAQLDDRELATVDVGAGTGFTTEGIIGRIDASQVTMLDQSPHQLAHAARKPALAACRKLQGDAESLPLATDSADRYISAGSIEYWPDPQRAIAEAYRVLRPGGIALIVGPLPPGNSLARWLADAWMLFPREDEYRAWFTAAGFTKISTTYVAPTWYRGKSGPYGIAIAGIKLEPGAAPLALAEVGERIESPMTFGRRLRFVGRFVLGSVAGAAFVPIGMALTLRARMMGGSRVRS